MKTVDSKRLTPEVKVIDIIAELAGHEDTFRARAERVAGEETSEFVSQRLQRLRGERVGLLFSWLEGRSRKLLPAAHWLAYGVHAPAGVAVKVPSCAELVILRALIREEAPGLRSTGRKLIEWSPFAVTLAGERNQKARGRPAAPAHGQAPASLA